MDTQHNVRLQDACPLGAYSVSPTTNQAKRTPRNLGREIPTKIDRAVGSSKPCTGPSPSGRQEEHSPIGAGKDQASDEHFNILVRAFEMVSSEWDHQVLAATLHQWFDIFNEQFFENALPACFLRIDCSRISVLGTYAPGRNGVGAVHEISINSRHVQGRPLYAVLATLLHEMAHEWQHLFGKRGKRGYHNKEFTRKCEALGIPCTGGYRSCTTGYAGPFVAILAQHDIVIPEEETKPVEERTASRGKSTLKKWRCNCTNIRAAVEIEARCLRCGELFRCSR